MWQGPRRGRRRRTFALLATAVLGASCATVSVQDEKRLGVEFERQMQSEVVLVHDPAVNRYVSDLGRRLVAAAGPQPFSYQFHVVEDPEINAFAGPGGQVYVNTGTILAARDVSQLAGVMAHEIGHVARRHVAKNLERQQAAGTLRQLGVLAGGVLFGQAGASAASIGGGLASLAVLNRFSREAEEEADAFAVEIVPRAGYDPEGLVRFFEMLRRQEDGGGGGSFLSSHPATADRIRATRALLAAAPHRAGLRRDDGGKLESIQRRVRQRSRPAPPAQKGS